MSPQYEEGERIVVMDLRQVGLYCASCEGITGVKITGPKQTVISCARCGRSHGHLTFFPLRRIHYAPGS